MAINIPQYIEDRIRRPVPADSGVVTGSTPVVSFGNAQNSRVATLGLNPSKNEFLEAGELLHGDERRLATKESLGIADLTIAPISKVLEVLEGCNAYFKRQPYREWFDQFAAILRNCDASYYDGSACHLDLVQWATDPTWRKLERNIRKRLIAEDARFLASQLQCESLRLMLVNGIGAWKQLRKSLGNDLEFQEVERITGFGHCDTRLFRGTVFGHVRVVAWSTNIQSSHGVTNELREEMARRIPTLAR